MRKVSDLSILPQTSWETHGLLSAVSSWFTGCPVMCWTLHEDVDVAGSRFRLAVGHGIRTRDGSRSGLRRESGSDEIIFRQDWRQSWGQDEGWGLQAGMGSGSELVMWSESLADRIRRKTETQHSQLLHPCP